MQILRKLRFFGGAMLSLGAMGLAPAHAQTNLAVTVTHAPALNSGTLKGSLQLLDGEATTLNSAAVSGDLLVPGTPTIVVNGKPAYAGTIAGSGSTSPTGYRVTLNSGCSLNYIRTRTTPVTMPVVPAPPAPTGTRSVSLNAAGQSYGNAATLCNLTLNSGAGLVALPAGTYGTLTVNGGSGLVLGVAGGTQAAAYNLQNLALNSGALTVVGPVVLTVANTLSNNGTIGASNCPPWLQLEIANGGLTLNSGASVYGAVTAPNGVVTINGGATLAGTCASSQFILNGGVVRWANPVIQPPVATNQSLTLAENSSTNLTLTGSDPQGFALTYKVVTPPAHGTLSGTPPNLTYLPATNYYGSDAFTFNVSDGVSNSAAATVSLTVSQVYYMPAAYAQNLTNRENSALPVTLTGSDPQGYALSYTVLTPPAHGTLSGTAPSLTYLPATNYYGGDAFTFRVNDGVSNSVAATISITNLPVDYAPLVVAGANQTVILPNNSVTLAGTVTYAKFPGTVDSVLWSVVSGPGSVVFSSAASLTTTATFGANGVYRLRLSASDSFLSGSNDLTVTVDAPPVVSATGSTNTFPGTITLPGTASDDGLPVNKLTVSWSVVSGPGTVIFGNAGLTNTTATFGTNGIYVLRLTADDTLATNHADITVMENLAPVASAGSGFLTNGLQAALAGEAGDDGLPYGVLTVLWSQTSGPGTATFGDVMATNTPVAVSQSGTYVFTLAATDGAVTNRSQVAVTFNLPPVVAAGAEQIVNFGTPMTLAGVVTDDGLPYNVLHTAWSQVSGPGTATFANATLTNTTVTFDQPGFYTLRLTGDDGFATNRAEVVIGLNSAPVVSAGASQTVVLGAAATLAGAVTDDGVSGAAVTVQWTPVSGPGGAVIAHAAATNTTVTFTQGGAYGFQLTANDGMTNASAQTTIIVDQAPAVVITAPAIINWPSNQVTLTGTVADDGYPTGGTLTGLWSSSSSNVTFSTTVQTNPLAGSSVTNVLVTTATFSQSGVYVLSLTADDTLATNTATVTVTVNQPPVVSAGAAQTVNLGAPVTLAGVATDDGLPVGSHLAVAWSVVSGAGTVVFGNANATNTTASFSTNGVYVLALTASDGAASSSGTVTITVNQAPAVVITAPAIINWPSNQVTLTGTVADDGYPTGGTLTGLWSSSSSNVTFSTTVQTNPLAGSSVTNVLVTTATFSQSGVYVLSLTADDTLATNTATVTVTVNQLPVVSAGETQTVNLGTPVTLAGVVTDDGLPYNELNAVWSEVSGPGTATFANATLANTTVTFDQPGFYTLLLTGDDGFATNSAVVVIGINAAPVVSAGASQTVVLGAAATLAGAVTDDGISELPVTAQWTQVSGPSGAVIANATATNTTVTFTQGGAYGFQLTANDGMTNASAQTTIIVDQGPAVAIAAPAILNWPGNQVTVTATVADDGYPSGSPLTSTWSLVSGPGTVSFSPGTQSVSLTGTNISNQVVATATFSQSGTYVLSLTADDTLATNTATVTVTVNQPPVVSAGAAQTVNFGATVALAGAATDDGLPFNQLHTVWAEVSGPGTATFANAAQTNTTVTFGQAGVYTLSLTADDGYATNTATCQIFAAAALQPYAVDTNTLVLFHFNETNGTVTTNVGTLGGNAYCVTNSVAVATPVVISNILGAAAYTTNFGTAAAFVAGKLIGYDYNKSGAFNADVSSTSLSADALPMSKLNMGNGGQTPWTLEAMICPSVTNANEEIITTDSSATSRGFQFRLNTAGQLELNLVAISDDITVGIPTLAKDPINGYVANTWYHVAAVYNGANVVLYWTKLTPTNTAANPIFTNTVAIGATFGATTGPLGIGNRTRGAASEPFQGKIDEVRISSVARSASQMFFTPSLPSATPTVLSPGNTVYVGMTVTLSATVSGPQPMTFAWQSDSGTSGVTWTNLPNSITNTYGLNTAGLPAGTNQYRLVVANGNGSATNTPATLVLVGTTGPVVSAGAAQAVTFGTTVTLAGTAVEYQSSSNTVNYVWSEVSGPGTATFANVTLTNTTVTFSQAGVYTLGLTAYDGFGTNSATCQILLAAPLLPYPVDANTLVLFHFDETNSTVTTNVGTLGGNAYCVTNAVAVTIPPTVNTILGAASYATNFGTAAAFVGGNLIGYDYNNNGYYEGDVSATSLSADALPLSLLNMGNGGQTPWTLEALICPTVINVNQEIITTDSYAGNRGFQFRINTAGQLELNLIYIGADITVAIPTPANDPVNGYVPNTWYHVAATYDGANVVLYWTRLSPTITAANPISTNAVAVGATFGAVTGPLGIGNRTRAAATEPFLGTIDEVRISSVARLATQMIFTPYSPSATVTTLAPANPVYAGTAVTLSATVSGAQPMTYTWQCDGGTSGVTWTNLSNSTTNTYVLNTSGMAAGFYEYRLVVANGSGAATNAAATLDLLAASGPVLVTDATATPAVVFTGGSTTLSANFTGTKPLSYQWYYVNNGTTTALVGATSATCPQAGLATNNSGGYFLLVSNNPPGLGPQTVASSVANLAVLPLSSVESGMYCELLAHPEQTYITASNPKLGWNYTPSFPNDLQVGYRIIVASTLALANAGTGDMWDSGQITSSNSLNVAYAGGTLLPNASYFWRVQTENSAGSWGPFSAIQQFNTAAKLGNNLTTAGVVYQQPAAGSANCYPLRYLPVTPVLVTTNSAGHWFIDFGSDAFGYATVQINGSYAGTNVVAAFGELASGNAVNSAPPSGSCIRYGTSTLTLQNSNVPYALQPPSFNGNPDAQGISPPAAFGTVMPFRYLELSGVPAGVTLTTNSVLQMRLQTEFNDNAATFSSSSAALNQIWSLCQYSMKALTFDGIYVDGDRERTPYEADTYLHMLSSYGVNNDFTAPRCAFEYLTNHLTWPTEWPMHMVFVAWADYLQTGDPYLMTKYYGFLTNKCMLYGNAGANGLVWSYPATGNNHGTPSDIIDWYRVSGDGIGNVDGYVAGTTNSVINAFYYRCLTIMSNAAVLTGHSTDAALFGARAGQVSSTYNSIFWNTNSQSYNDCEGSTHSSVDANFFPLAFGLVPATNQTATVNYIHSRIAALGIMPAGVYGAQYMLEGLFQTGDSDTALGLITTNNSRSWMNMINLGSTITSEAWSTADKSNEDLNHAWGAAPGNLIPRYVLGVRPLAAGYGQILIQPQLGQTLTYVQGTVPTIRGPVSVTVTNSSTYELDVTIPGNVIATIMLPTTNTTAYVDGAGVSGTVSGSWLTLNNIGSGQHTITLSAASGAVSHAVMAVRSSSVPALTATAGDGQVTLSWNAVANATGYSVKTSLSAGGNFASTANLAGRRFTHAGLTNGVLYYYLVAATNGAGLNANSTIVSARPTSAVAPQLGLKSGPALQFSWPAQNTGWLLQVQTNALGTGLGTNWTTVDSSDSTNQTVIQPDAATPGVFYRLVHP